ncbi:hypothetical protein B1748_33045 [Paenibacillus sp. MY03]|uniref:LysM peptidoglycan-binding domain-containing protein n=1 Tax=Paenibacillus sp. MY03 TaxID=302980 RepID=UPI000B3C3553|nr:LysM peptidoglycan-binding domain-containing protein [Paenibacillus sp. MY03]OUS68796.1 hypothetical protein B1748_33045 [Paenibacillus sp. MY03]
MTRMRKWVISLAVLALASSPSFVQAKSGQADAGISIYYGVKAGDTLYGISKRHYLTSDYVKVAKQNGLDPKAKLKVGARLKLKDPLVLDHYTVAKGDTLFAIAGKYFSQSNYIGILMQVNGLTGTTEIKKGRTLSIPMPSGQRSYQVKEGDTLQSISAKYYKQSDYVAAIAKSNGIDGVSGTIKLGQSLLIPNPF